MPRKEQENHTQLHSARMIVCFENSVATYQEPVHGDSCEENVRNQSVCFYVPQGVRCYIDILFICYSRLCFDCVSSSRIAIAISMRVVLRDWREDTALTRLLFKISYIICKEVTKITRTKAM